MITKFKDFLNESLFKQDKTIKLFDRLLIEAIIDFMKDKYNFNSTITIKKTFNNKLYGDVVLNDDSIKNNKFILHYNSNQSYVEIIKSIIHEMTHIKQVSKGELKPSDDYKSLIWNNIEIISMRIVNKLSKNIEKYEQLPWEAEAYKNMRDKELREELYNSVYWLSLKGKDSTLDFIIDNL